MAGMILILSFLLFSGTFLLNTSAQSPSSILLNVFSGSSSPAQPSTTTHAPSKATTQAPLNTTTHAPSNTTTHAPSNTTTHATIQTTTILPTKPSPPEIGKYNVTDGKEFCIIASMGLEIQIDNSTKDKTDKKYFNIQPLKTKANGICNDSKSNLLLEFPEGSINFNFVKENKIYFIEEVAVQFHVTSAERWNGTSGKLKLLSTDVGYAVKCTRTPSVQLGDNMELVLADVTLQAFDIKNGILGKDETCSYDRNNNIAVPIAITVLVIIVIAIVIYFVWHKKSSAGYERI